MRDPMMAPPSDTEKPKEVPSTSPVLAPTRKKVIMPLSDFTVAAEPDSTPPVQPAKAEPEAEVTAPPKPITQIAKPLTIVADPDEQEEPVITTASGEPVTVLEPIAEPGVPDTKREEKALTPDQIAAAEKSAQEREAKLQEMIEDEQYFLPINAAQERRSRRVAIIGLVVIVVLALAWYNVALDAGLLPNQFDVPHTSFFTIK